ncbi:unnamed protein product [Porites lobata]|uniref:G-protein coupled receptors family 1 profile domain-containing protein n=1 Tax=Porites lobata TaxID=104759 RepID=A0ABN8R7W6_9CNID|nr:unnamed protein product [Porites lobata]
MRFGTFFMVKAKLVLFRGKLEERYKHESLLANVKESIVCRFSENLYITSDSVVRIRIVTKSRHALIEIRISFYNSRQKFVSTIANFVTTICLLNGLLMLLTIMGNVLVLTAMLPTPSLRSLSTIFLCSLAASHILVGFVVQPIYIGFRLNPGPELEHLAYIFVSLACSVSFCTMTAISVDRFMALHFHLRYPDMMTIKRAVNISLSLWFLACTTSCIRLY